MAKEYDYLVTLKKTDTKLFDNISQLLLVFSLAFFVFSAVNTGGTIALFYYLVSFLILAAWVYVKQLRVETVSYRIPLFIAVVGWLYHIEYHILVTILYMLAYIFEKQVKKPVEIGVDEDGIAMNQFPVKKYPWPQLNNVVIKDGLITIDFKNNKILQKELASDISPELEAEFNNFCSTHLSSITS